MNYLHYLLILLYFGFVRETRGLTQDEVDLVIRKSKKALGKAKPAMVRLAFHDCVGGCDGCLNINDPDNKGLETVIADLETVYQDEGFSDIISRADLWALMGIWSVQESIERNNEDCLRYGPNGTEPAPNDHDFYENCQIVPDLSTTFKWGREDCETAPYTEKEENLPSATLGYDDLMSYFSQEFGFSPRQVTALMGVHTLGKADIFNSGFHGTWVNNEQGYFNNRYYTNMVNSSLNWKLVTKTCESLPNVESNLCHGEVTGWEWNVGFTGFNLNADMAIYKHFSVDADGKPSCEYVDCPLSSSARYAISFGESNDVWIQEFSKVYFNMLKNGYRRLKNVQ